MGNVEKGLGCLLKRTAQGDCFVGRGMFQWLLHSYVEQMHLLQLALVEVESSPQFLHNFAAESVH